MRDLRNRLDGILSKLAEIEGPAGLARNTEKELCQQVQVLVEAVKEILDRFEKVEEIVRPDIPRPLLLRPPTSQR